MQVVASPHNIMPSGLGCFAALLCCMMHRNNRELIRAWSIRTHGGIVSELACMQAATSSDARKCAHDIAMQSNDIVELHLLDRQLALTFTKRSDTVHRHSRTTPSQSVCCRVRDQTVCCCSEDDARYQASREVNR